MEKTKKSKLYLMLQHISDYCAEQPNVIGRLCNDIGLPQVYEPAIDMMIEAFLSLRSFCLLMQDGLISNASAILRVAIEQISSVYVFSTNPKALTSFLGFNKLKKDYYKSEGDEHKALKAQIAKACNYHSEQAIKEYLDYGWIKCVIDNVDNKRGATLIRETANFEEMSNDIEDYLNSFAHGQSSMFPYFRAKKGDKLVSRIIMMSGKLFLALCYSKQELLVNSDITEDKFFDMYVNAKILYLDLNARATEENINYIIKTTKKCDEAIKHMVSTFDNMRLLLYDSHLEWKQVNFLSNSYAVQARIILFVILCKKIFGSLAKVPDGIRNLKQLIESCDVGELKSLFKQTGLNVDMILDFLVKIDGNWGPMENDHQFRELDELFITDLSSLVHTVIEKSAPI